MKTHRSRVVLETKIDARDYDGAMREMERSLKLLQIDQIDLLLHHAFFNPEEVDRVLAADGAERAVRRMIDQKAVRFRKDAIGGAFDSRFQTDRNPDQHRFAPPPEAFERPHPTPLEFLRYALSLPIASAVVGTDSLATLDSYAAGAERFTPLGSAERQSIHERAQVFASTGYWIPRRTG